MVVVLIIGILIAIALPTFQGARQRADAPCRAVQRPQRARRRQDVRTPDVDSYGLVRRSRCCSSIEPFRERT